MAEKISAFQQVDIDKALDVFEGNRYNMIIAAAHRAREIASARLIADRATVKPVYENKPTVAALKELAAGKYGQEYLIKVGKQKKV